MTSIDVQTQPPYRILLEPGKVMRCASAMDVIPFFSPSVKVMVVTDDCVGPLYAQMVIADLHTRTSNVHLFTFAHGEAQKNATTYLALLNTLSQEAFDRHDVIVALGGGVVGDIAGFAAATYMRGIAYIQIPTTLLACLDSAVGGKTGINLERGKNMVGAFHQPSSVLVDPTVLKTLPEAAWIHAMGEGIKYGLLCGGDCWELVCQGIHPQTPQPVLERFIALCLQYKARLVATDEKDHGARMLLNLGHTFGHALEKASGYTQPHGLCVGQGLYIAAQVSHKMGLLPEDRVTAIQHVLQSYHIPLPAWEGLSTLLPFIAMDKKRQGANLSLVILHDIGQCAPIRLSFNELSHILLS